MGIAVISVADDKVITTQDKVIKGITFDKFWISSLAIQAFDLNGESSIDVELTKYGLDDQGLKVPAPEDSVVIRVKGLFEKLAGDPLLGAVLDAMMAYVEDLAKQEGWAK